MLAARVVDDAADEVAGPSAMIPANAFEKIPIRTQNQYHVSKPDMYQGTALAVAARCRTLGGLQPLLFLLAKYVYE